MAVRVVERRLGTVPWLVVRGPAAEAFASLGAHLAAEIRAVVEGLPSLAALHRHVASEPGRHRFAAVRRATQSRFPGPWAELAALAAGAGVGLDDLALLNFRGDLGVTGPDPAGAGPAAATWRGGGNGPSLPITKMSRTSSLAGARCLRWRWTTSSQSPRSPSPGSCLPPRSP